MNKISLNLTSDEDNGAVVHLNASFASRELAIAFHAKVAALCEQANRSHQPSNVTDIGRKLLGRA